jgi:cytochrome c biogenesis protein
MSMGCMVTFFMSHQQVVVEVQPQESGSKVLLAGTTNKNKVGFQHQMQQMADKLEKLAAEAGG